MQSAAGADSVPEEVIVEMVCALVLSTVEVALSMRVVVVVTLLRFEEEEEDDDDDDGDERVLLMVLLVSTLTKDDLPVIDTVADGSSGLVVVDAVAVTDSVGDGVATEVVSTFSAVVVVGLAVDVAFDDVFVGDGVWVERTGKLNLAAQSFRPSSLGQHQVAAFSSAAQ